MSERASQSKRRYTWGDYQTWPDDERWEIIGGEAFLLSSRPRTGKELIQAEQAALHAMSPSPIYRHQRVATNLTRELGIHFKGHRCQLIGAPMDVVFSEEDVVQPDLMVVCSAGQIKRTHIEGAPALVVEILSDASASRDRLEKLNLYARAGVKEYWIVTPHPSLVEVLWLEGGRYVVHKVFGKDDTLTSPTFPEMRIALADVFDFPLEPREEPPIVKEPPAPKYRATASAAT